MITNTDATLFVRTYNPSTRLDEWGRVYIPRVWWNTEEKASVTTDGLKIADMTTIRIPDTSIEVKKDDYIVKGDYYKGTIKTVKDLAGTEYIKVTGANYNTFGSNPHIKVVGV